jgi:hypothetical protein
MQILELPYFYFTFGYFVISGSDRRASWSAAMPRMASVEFGATIGELFCFAKGAISGNDSWRQGRCGEDGDKCQVANAFDDFHGISFSQFLIIIEIQRKTFPPGTLLSSFSQHSGSVGPNRTTFQNAQRNFLTATNVTG